MNKKTLIGVALGALVVGLLVAGSLGLFKEKNVGSVAQANEYKIVRYPADTSATNTVIFTGAGTLGSIVITSSTDKMIVYDWNSATSTVSTTIAVFKPGASEGTYTFDASIYYGLQIRNLTTTTGEVVVTYR